MLKKVIHQLTEENYKALHEELSANRGEKFSKLLELYRNTDFEDRNVRDEMGINSTSYYALKSRLLDKTQEYLFRIAHDSRGDLLKNISSIPSLIHHAPRETAIILLQYLETELIEADMPRALISVYNGLKKLHLQSDQYYHYQQLYNKTVAYTLAVDKADELLCSFNRELGEYLLSGDKSKIDILSLYLKELRHLNKIYKSHRLNSFLLVATISYSIFTDSKNEIPETEETTEELLKELLQILEKNPEDSQYKFLFAAWHFLNFEYYHRLSLHKNSIPSFEKINHNIPQFLLMGHTCPAPQFLLSKIEFSNKNKKSEDLIKDCIALGIIPDKQNSLEYIYNSLFSAACHFHSQKYQEGVTALNNCLNEISFKNYPFAEFQVKLFQTLLCILAEKIESAEIIFRSVSRKLQTEDFPENFPQCFAFSKFLKIAINDNSAGKNKKVKDAYAAFSLINNGQHQIFKYIPLTESHLQQLAK